MKSKTPLRISEIVITFVFLLIGLIVGTVVIGLVFLYYEPKVNALNEQIQTLSHEKETLTTENTSLNESLQAKENELKQMEPALQELNVQIQKLIQEKETLTAENVTLKQSLTAKDGERKQMETKLAEFDDKLAKLDSTIKQKETTLAELGTQLETLQDKLVKQDSAVKQKDAEIAQNVTKLAELGKQLDALKNTLKEKEEEIAKLKISTTQPVPVGPQTATENAGVKPYRDDMEQTLRELKLLREGGFEGKELEGKISVIETHIKKTLQP